MGCSASRLDDNGAVIPIKTRPLFLHRLEEFKIRRHSQALKGTTSSKKELLLEAREEDQNGSTKQDLCIKTGKDSYLHDETGSCVTSEGSKAGSPERMTKKDSKKEDASKKDVHSEEISREKGNFEENEGRSIEPLAEDEAKVECVMDGDVKKMEEVEDHNDDDDDHDDDDDDDADGRMMRHREDNLFFPGSPSFRVYFVDETKNNKDEGLDDHLIADVAPTDDDPIPSKKLPVAEEAKKGKKRSFKKVLPTGKQAMNIFKVRSCMSSNSHHDRTHLLPAKAHA